MKKGINLGAVPGRFSLDEAFAMLNKAGFDGVELNMEAEKRKDGKLSLHCNCTESELAEIKELAKRHNLKITSFVTGLLWGLPLTSSDASVRENGMIAIKKMLDYAEYFGSDTVLVVPGYVSSDISYDEAYENALTALKELKPYAEAKKVAIGVENVWNKFLLSPLEMRDFIDKIDSPYVGAYFDIGNVVVNGYPEQWIKILGTRIKKLHAKGFKTSVGNITGFVNLLEGDIDWKKVMEAIKQVGYDDFITAELDGYANFPMNLLFETSHAFDSIFAVNN